MSSLLAAARCGKVAVEFRIVRRPESRRISGASSGQVRRPCADPSPSAPSKTRTLNLSAMSAASQAACNPAADTWLLSAFVRSTVRWRSWREETGGISRASGLSSTAMGKDIILAGPVGSGHAALRVLRLRSDFSDPGLPDVAFVSILHLPTLLPKPGGSLRQQACDNALDFKRRGEQHLVLAVSGREQDAGRHARMIASIGQGHRTVVERIAKHSVAEGK